LEEAAFGGEGAGGLLDMKFWMIRYRRGHFMPRSERRLDIAFV